MGRFNVTLEDQLKKEAGDLLYNKYGLKLPAATRLFLTQTVSLGKLPFDYLQPTGINFVGIEENTISTLGNYYNSDWSIISLLKTEFSGLVAKLSVTDSESISLKAGLLAAKPIVYNLDVRGVRDIHDPNVWLYIYTDTIATLLNRVLNSLDSLSPDTSVEFNVLVPKKNTDASSNSIDFSTILPRSYTFIDDSVAHYHLIDFDLLDYYENFYNTLADQYLAKFKDNFTSKLTDNSF